MKTFTIDNTILTADKKATYLSSDLSASAINMSVQSIIGLTSTAVAGLQIGETGQEKSEIITVSNGTAPTGTTVHFQTACVFDHPQDTKVYLLDYNQMALSRSTGISSQKGTLITTGIQVDQLKTIYNDVTNTTGYGFVEFYDSINARFSSASDPIPYAGYADNSVYMVKKRALNSAHEQLDPEIVTNEYLDDCLAEARREYHNAQGKRPYRRKYNVDIGNVSTGMFRIALPTDVEKPHTAENVYGVRIGSENNMVYFDKKEWDKEYQGVKHTTLLTAYAIGNQDLYCDNVRDLSDSGSVNLESDTIAYSAKGVSGGTLRISTAGAFIHSADVDVWQGASMGNPEKFTVWMNNDGTNYVYFSCPVSTSYVNQNIFADYYSTKKTIDSDADELDEPDNVQDGFVHFLAWKIKKAKNKGVVDLKDDDYLKWELIKQNSTKNEVTGVNISFIPDVSRFNF
jgi:hypothetical protein